MQDVDDRDRLEGAIGKGERQPVVVLYLDDPQGTQDDVDADHARGARRFAEFLGNRPVAGAHVEKRVDVTEELRQRAQKALLAGQRDVLVMVLEGELFQRFDDHCAGFTATLSPKQAGVDVPRRLG